MSKVKPAFTAVLFLAAGTALALLLAELGLRAAGLAARRAQAARNLGSVSSGGAYRIMCIGESTTMNQYPRFLERALEGYGAARDGRKVVFKVIDRGIAGTSTGALLGMMEENLALYRPDMVVAMIGINDTQTLVVSPPGFLYRHLRVMRFLRWLGALELLPRAWAADSVSGRLHGCRLFPSPDMDCIQALRDGGHNAEASELYGRISAGTGQDAQTACRMLAGMQAQRLDLDGAVRTMDGCLRRMPARILYVEAAMLEIVRQNMGRAEVLLKKALACRSEPDDWRQLPTLYEQFARVYAAQGRTKEEEESLKKGSDSDPSNFEAYHRLADFYAMHGRGPEAVAALEKALAVLPKGHPREYVIVSALADLKKDKAFARRARALELRYNSSTAANYRAIRDMLFARGIRLVAVQYPMRPVAQVRAMLEYDPRVIYVDNESLFRDAVAKYGYGALFTDRFGGDFGHCTDKGNELLAGNIAKAVAAEF